jgi:hypothetical protein
MLETSVLPPELTWGDRTRGTSLPGIFVRRARPAVGEAGRGGPRPDGPFATLVLLSPHDVAGASRSLARACGRHRVPYAWVHGGRRMGEAPDPSPV